VRLPSLDLRRRGAMAGGISPVVPSYEGRAGGGFEAGQFWKLRTAQSDRQNNTIQFIDNFIKTFGTHSFQVGLNYHYDQINERNTSCPNGCFTFNGNETGIDYADFLLGAPSNFSQAGADRF